MLLRTVPVAYGLTSLLAAVFEYFLHRAIPCHQAGMLAWRVAVYLSFLTDTPGPVPFPTSACSVDLSGSLPVFRPERFLVP